MSKQVYSEPLVTLSEQSWAQEFRRAGSPYGQALEEVFDAEIANKVADPLTRAAHYEFQNNLPTVLEFTCLPENKDKLVRAFRQALAGYYERGGVYSPERALEFFKSVKGI